MTSSSQRKDFDIYCGLVMEQLNEEIKTTHRLLLFYRLHHTSYVQPVQFRSIIGEQQHQRVLDESGEYLGLTGIPDLLA